MLLLALSQLKVGIDGFSLCGLICMPTTGKTTDYDSVSSQTSKSSQTRQRPPEGAEEREEEPHKSVIFPPSTYFEAVTCQFYWLFTSSCTRRENEPFFSTALLHTLPKCGDDPKYCLNPELESWQCKLKYYLERTNGLCQWFSFFAALWNEWAMFSHPLAGEIAADYSRKRSVTWSARIGTWKWVWQSNEELDWGSAAPAYKYLTLPIWCRRWIAGHSKDRNQKGISWISKIHLLEPSLLEQACHLQLLFYQGDFCNAQARQGSRRCLQVSAVLPSPASPSISGTKPAFSWCLFAVPT